jgi:hypothetical protein
MKKGRVFVVVFVFVYYCLALSFLVLWLQQAGDSYGGIVLYIGFALKCLGRVCQISKNKLDAKNQ